MSKTIFADHETSAQLRRRAIERLPIQDKNELIALLKSHENAIKKESEEVNKRIQ